MAGQQGPMPPIPPQQSQQAMIYDAPNCDYDPPSYMDQNFGNPYDCPEGNFFHYKIPCYYRPVVPGCAGCAMAHPDFGRSVNPISTRGTDYAHLITTGTPGFSDLPTALNIRLLGHIDQIDGEDFLTTNLIRISEKFK